MRASWMRRIAGVAGGLAIVVVAGCGGEKASTLATPEPADTLAADGAIAISVTEDGFVPAEVTVAAGQPVRLVVTRKTTKTCANEFVMKEHDIHQPLPLDTPVEITFTPTQAGELRYACAMDMIAGKVIVK